MRHAVLASFLLIALGAIGIAQTFRGGISGIITDQTGAIVPEAAVKATNDATGFQRRGIRVRRFAVGLLHSGGFATRILSPDSQWSARVGRLHV
jgi:hypothetical protein